ncbi:receptor-like protein EIX2 isoform X3 [Rosa rugosa]|uniref:receptor-like protein EIX2 isoform X3 n=1 Tax=Rosa rugosa TaxID=74645 RepID=UPI002B402AD0|nr:receptor-like protein EIX2 isoform X3 [Rosa rugosa]
MPFVVMSGRSSIHSGSVLARLLWLVIVSSAATSCCCSSAAGNISTSNDVNVRCMEREKHALLQFKQGLVDGSNALASWESKENCCEWRGVACDNQTGELPSLENCTLLLLVDLGFNNLSGKIQAWIGSSLQKLWVLQLRSNHFSGSIPSSICSLPLIRVLDLSQNNISGVLPHCLNNLTAFSSVSQEVDDFPFPFSDHDFVLQLIWKGAETEYGKNFRYLRSIDISSNNLTGVIPENITYMLGLRSLNLSRNNLTGVIPGKFGQLEVLEVLDLSRNHLSGSIPDSFRNLHSIAVLNLSINNLSGRIPSSTQLLTFTESSFAGNVGLCGPPLTTKCPGDRPSEDPKVTGGTESDGFITPGFYAGIGIGFLIGFVGVCLALPPETSWRYVQQCLRQR